MDKLRAIVADDERLGRDLVCQLLRREPDVEIVAVCSTGEEAVDAISELRPDMAFLDIRMPDLEGLSVVRRFDRQKAPLFIMVTAFASHAVEAFDVRAFDYVMKPVDKSRFARAVTDARVAILNRRNQSVLSSTDVPTDIDHIRVRVGDELIHVPIARVWYFEACNQYVRLHVGNANYLISTESLSSLEAKLDPSTFFRVHRSSLVNANFVDAIRLTGALGRSLSLSDGRRLPVSRRNSAVLGRLATTLAERKFGSR